MIRLFRILGVLAFGLVAACTSIERAAIPTAELTDTGWQVHDPNSKRAVDHGPWSRFLAQYRVEGADGIARLRYGAVTPDDHAALRAYLATLETTDIAALNRPEQLAFWINLYNAKTVDLVLAAYPVGSIREIEGGLLKTGPWNKPVVTVSGKPLSLNDIEHQIVRPLWQDPRVHYGFNCAALGCPNLDAVAYTGKNIDQRLDANARAYINDPRGFRFDGEALTASKIYAWFVEDFGGNEAGVIAHALPYAEPSLADRLEATPSIRSYAYDWGLNDTATLPGS